MERLIDQIYEVPFTSGGWKSLSRSLEQLFEAPFAIFVVHPDRVTPVGASGPFDHEMAEVYSHPLWREDRAMTALQTAPTGTVVLDSQLLSQRERKRSRLYKDVLAPNGLELGMYASVARGRVSQLVVVSARRAARFSDYGQYEVELMKRIVPHLQRSFRTWHRVSEIETERQAALDAIAHVTLGIALVDKTGKLHFANKVAEDQIAKGALRVSNGRVTSRSPSAARALREAVEAAALNRRAEADRLTLQTEEGVASSVLVSPVANGAFVDLNSDGLAMLMIGGHEPKAVEEAAISDAYGLTRAEARLLAALVQGERVPAYAQRHGISVATAKSHLKALFDKVGERRQADLIRRAVSDPVLRARSTL